MKFKKTAAFFLACAISALSFSGCGREKKPEPVNLTLWHVYGEQADSPMDKLVEEFNSTVGKDEGIIINVTSNSNAYAVGQELLDAQSGKAGAKEMPDLFFCHASNASALGVDNLVNWNDFFTEKELSRYIPDFVNEGIIDDKLSVFPISKSTHLIFINGSMFDRFSEETGVTYDQLAAWDGFFDAAEKFYSWSGGKPFCAMDYLLRAVELSLLEKNPEAELYDSNEWYAQDNAEFKNEWQRFASSIVKGHIIVSDLYSNTQIMTGETACGIGSSAAILYYNDTVTYPDNTSEPMNLKVLPLPGNDGAPLLATQAGVGLCAAKTTNEKAEAAAVFAKYLTESERNLKFVTDAGYMPVTTDAFAAMADFSFQNESYKNLYAALNTMVENYTFLKEPSFENYYPNVQKLYDMIRSNQKLWAERFSKGESTETLLEECSYNLDTII